MRRLPALLFVIVLLISLSGCRTYVWLPENRIWPKKPAFGIVPSTNIVEYMDSGIDCNSVYVFRLESGRGFNYLRFWPNGKMLVRPTVGIPTLQDAESFTNAYIGYYRLTNGTVSSEVFLPAGSPPWACGYEVLESQIEKEVILHLSSSFNGCRPKDLRKYNIRFVKHPMPGMKRQPDW